MTVTAPSGVLDAEAGSAGFAGAVVREVLTARGQEIYVSGRMDVHTVPELRRGLHDALERGSGDLRLHLRDAEIYDATGLGVIVGVHHRALREGRRLVLVDLSPRLERVLRASRLHRVLTRSRALPTG